MNPPRRTLPGTANPCAALHTSLEGLVAFNARPPLEYSPMGAVPAGKGQTLHRTDSSRKQSQKGPCGVELS